MSAVGTRGRLLGEGVMTSGTSIAAVALSAIGSLLVARVLGPTGRGTTAAIGSLALLCSGFLTFGTPAAAAFALGRSPASEHASLGRAFSVVGLSVAVFVGLGYAAIGFATHPGGAGVAVLLAGLAVAIANAMQQVLSHMVLTSRSLQTYAVVQVLPAVLTTLAVASLAMSGELTVFSAVVASALGSLSACAVASGSLRRARLIGPMEVPAAVRAVRPYMGFALMTVATVSLTQLVQRLDILLVAGLRSAREAGIYAVAAQVGDLLLVVPAAIGTVMFRRGARGDAGHRVDLNYALRWTASTSLVAALIIGAAAEPVLTQAIGREYLESISPLRLLLPGAVLLGLQSVVSNYIAARGRVRAVLVAWLTGALLSTVLDILVIPHYGVRGAAIVSSLSYAAVLSLHVRALAIVDRREETGTG